MNQFETQYKQLLMRCLLSNDLIENRTGVKTKVLFNQSFSIDLKKGFPIVTSKKIFFDKAFAEFEWIFNGHTDLQYLKERNVNWWDAFAIDNKLGKVYGYQVRKFNGIFDQVKYCVNELKNNSRRALITFWNPTDLKEQALPCCYTSFEFVRINDKLNMKMNFRSSDLFLGLPYDIIVGALFLIEISKLCNLKANELGISISNAHIYENHFDSVKEYYLKENYVLPEYKNGELLNYKSHKFIKADLVV